MLLQEIKDQGWEIEWLQYSRKNYTYPTYQKAIHKEFTDEIGFLRDLGVFGDSHVVGPISQDHYYFFAADAIHRCEKGLPAPQETDQDLILNMHDIDHEAARMFFQPEKPCEWQTMSDKEKQEWECKEAKRITKESGIADIFPESQIQEKLFEPCGYSMNGLQGEAYQTIHITPESHCSYASFETNTPLQSYTGTVEKVIKIFQPNRFTAMFFGDLNSPIVKAQGTSSKEAYWEVTGYAMKCLCFQEFEPGYFMIFANYLRDGSLPLSPTGIGRC